MPLLSAICSPGFVRLPHSSTRRGAITWIKLLTAVDQTRQGGFAFQGTLLRPGAQVEAATLPDPAIFIECAGTEGGHGNNRGQSPHLLWRYDQRARDWMLLAQSVSLRDEWAADLMPIAIRELNQVAPESNETVDRELERLEHLTAADLSSLCSRLYDRMASAKMAESTA